MQTHPTTEKTSLWLIAGACAGGTAFVALAIYLIAFWPHGMAAGSEKLTVPERFTMVNEKRRTAVQIVGGLSLIATAVFTAWNAHSARANAKAATKNAEAATRNALIAEAKQTSDRFIKATENLDSPNMSTRVGAVYSLGVIAHESEQNHHIVFDVLGAYLKDKTKLMKVETQHYEFGWMVNHPSLFPPADIQSVISVVGRRNPSNDMGRNINLVYCTLPGIIFSDKNTSYRGVNLSASCLVGMYATDCDFSRVYLLQADLTNAILSRSDLTRASGEEAKFVGAQMDGVKLLRANLLNADLTGAVLTNADFTDAILKGADLRRADLEGATNLTQEQVNSATISLSTILPANLSYPPILVGDTDEENK